MYWVRLDKCSEDDERGTRVDHLTGRRNGISLICLMTKEGVMYDV